MVRGKYDHVDNSSAGNGDLAVDGDIKDTIADESKEGEVTHFQALATAVSGTVGNGKYCGGGFSNCIGWSRCNILDDCMWLIGNVFKIC